MNEEQSLEIVNKLFKSIFGKENPYTLEELLEKYAFDIKLPKMVNDSTTHEVTWADSICNGKFITNDNMQKIADSKGWMQPKKDFQDLEELIKCWNEINYVTTERIYDSINVSKSDTIYRCENVYYSTNCNDSKNMIYCDSCGNCELLLASSRSYGCNFCIRCDDSTSCSNSYSVICSGKVRNSFFIQDCFDLDECLFCSHISSKKYCIANIQFEKEEYEEIKQAIIEWIFSDTEKNETIISDN